MRVRGVSAGGEGKGTSCGEFQLPGRCGGKTPGDLLGLSLHYYAYTEPARRPTIQYCL